MCFISKPILKVLVDLYLYSTMLSPSDYFVSLWKESPPENESSYIVVSVSRFVDPRAQSRVVTVLFFSLCELALIGFKYL